MTSDGSGAATNDTASPYVRIVDAYPAKALNAPGDKADVVVELEASAPMYVHLELALLDRGQLISTARSSTTAALGSAPVTIGIDVPAADARGYSVRVEATWDGGRGIARTALLVASHWRLLPRYGFLSNFHHDADGRDSAAGPTALLARFHITAVQFYDWMYRHYQFLPPEDAVREGETFTDAMDREVSLQMVRRRVSECHERCMAAIAYGAVYGPEPEFILERPDWLLYDAAGEPLHLIDRFYITDLRPGGWRQHILGEFEAAVSHLHFDGIHMDQYGFPKLAYDSAGNMVDVSAEFGSLIDEAAERVSQVRKGAAVIFNTVNDWPLDRVAYADQAAIYIEVWSPNDAYRDLVALVRRARQLSGRQAILAAYLRPFHEPGVAAEWSLRYATAVINAAGGHHLLLGEGDGVLREPYYPDHGHLTAEGVTITRRYYDHTAAHTHYLHAQDLRPVERYYATGVNTALNLRGAASSVWPEPGKVWIAIARRHEQIVVNLVNLTALEDDLWDAPRGPPTRLPGLSLDCEPFVRVTRATWSSPDPGGATGSELEVHVQPGGRVTIPLPELELWQTIVIDHS